MEPGGQSPGWEGLNRADTAAGQVYIPEQAQFTKGPVEQGRKISALLPKQVPEEKQPGLSQADTFQKHTWL